MKKLRITVNGKVYDVLVQVLEDDEQIVPGAGLGSSLPSVGPPAVTQPAAAVPAPGAAAPAIGRRTPVRSDPNLIRAPIAGVVQKVFVQEGATVEAKAPVVLLDAMKMDTYIYAPRDGEVAEVAVKAGDAVQVGDRLIQYKAE
jgi:glutaconyl-CoA/methylmalonyl-CoA decarboxylase subunit gamma